MAEHLQPVLVIQRQDDLAVGIRFKGIALGLQLRLDGTEPVQLAVADHAVRAAEEGLHALRRQPHDGQTAKAQQAELRLGHPLVVRPAGGGTHQIFGKFFLGQIMSRIAQHTTHFDDTPFFFHHVGEKKKTAFSPLSLGRIAVLIRGAT